MRNVNHKCTIISNFDYGHYYNRSKQYFLKKYNGNYCKKNITDYRDWSDERNFSITHFGINTKYMSVEGIAIDNLHNRLSNICSIMKFIREYLQ